MGGPHQSGTQNMSENMQNRLGRIVVSRAFIRECPEGFAKVCAHLSAVVINLHHEVYNQLSEYVMMSPLFDVVGEGQRIPQYTITIFHSEDGEETVQSVDRVDPNVPLPDTPGLSALLESIKPTPEVPK